MKPFINFSELYAAGGTFDKQFVDTREEGTTIIYGGYSPNPNPELNPEAMPNWLIRRLIVIETRSGQEITCMWAKGSWDEKETLTYRYGKP